MSTAPDKTNVATPAARKPAMPLKAIIAIVAREMGLKPADLCAPERTASLALARQLAMWFARRHTTLSLPRIGKALGGRHHTTVLHGIRATRKRLRTDAAIRQARDRINQCLAAWTPGEPIMVAAPALIAPPVAPETPAKDDMPVAFYFRDRQAPGIRSQRDYLRAQDEAFCAAMRAAGYVEGPAPQGGGQ